MFWKPSNDGKKFESAVEYGKKQVDARVKDNVEYDKELAAKDKELANKQQELRQNVKEHTAEASKTNSNIVDAANNGDITDLIRIHRELNKKRH